MKINNSEIVSLELEHQGVVILIHSSHSKSIFITEQRQAKIFACLFLATKKILKSYMRISFLGLILNICWVILLKAWVKEKKENKGKSASGAK